MKKAVLFVRGGVVVSIVILLSISSRVKAANEEAVSSYQPVVRCYNIEVGELSALSGAAEQQGLRLEKGSTREQLGLPAVVLWEGRQQWDPTAEQIVELGEYVRKGGRLIVSLDASPGTGVFKMREFLPTTAWRSLLQAAYRGGAGPAVAAGAWDPEMFGANDRASLHVPYFYALRPFDGVERGMERYERFELDGGVIGGDPLKAGDPSFTRPLLNRDWKTRIAAADMSDSGLLITGEYGAGRVAVFASTARAANAQMWGPLLKWLDSDRPAKPIEASTKSAVEISSVHVDAGRRVLVVEIVNRGDRPVEVEVIGRLMTWEHALIGDVGKSVEVTAGTTGSVELAIPAQDAMAYQAEEVCDAMRVEVGALVDGGSTLASQKNLDADFRPNARVAVALDNLRQIKYPFADVPAEYGQDRSTPNRMGEPVTAYAYPPGSDVNVTMNVGDGIRNLAPMAKITDETQPANPSVVALNDELQPANTTPTDGIVAYGVWQGTAGIENSLLFTFPKPVHVNEVVITGNSPDSPRGEHNPGEAIVELDGKQVADVKTLDAEMKSQSCAVRLKFDLTEASQVRVRFPWLATAANGRRRQAPQVGEIEIHGYSGDAPAPLAGKLTLTLADASTQSRQVLSEQDVQVDPGGEREISFKVPGSATATDPAAARFFRVEATLAAESGTKYSAATTFMTIQPVNPLKPVTDILPPEGAIMNFVVTHGFRNCFDFGPGTREANSAWGTPDDLVWAYARQMKQTGSGAKSTAHHFFVSECDLGHYCAPWSIFPNGEVLFDAATPTLVKKMQKDGRWNRSDIVQLGFGDRWDTGPAASLLYSWPEIVAFDEYLRSQNQPALTGRTRADLVREIQAKYQGIHSAWEMERYAHTIKELTDAFAAVGKKLNISGQGTPLVPDRYEQAISQTIQGMSDDTTWGMSQEDVPGTTGRQMATMAFNPVWKMDEVLVWGYDSAVLNNSHWHAGVGTTESSRRHYSDAGWRGIIDPQGKYRLINTYGYGMNANVSWCMSLNDWQESWRMQERLSLLTPDAPIGAGIVIGNASWNDPAHATFSGGGMGGSPADSTIDGVAHAFSTLCHLRIPMAFSTNVAALAKWSGNTPIVVLNLGDLSEDELSILKMLHDRGTRMIGFTGDKAISPDAAAIFGVTTDGSVGGDGTRNVGTALGKPVMATSTTLLIETPYETITPDDLSGVAQSMRNTLDAGLVLPEGTAGYGFSRGRQRFIVVEDWREQGRDVQIRLRAKDGSSSASAVNVNDHTAVKIWRDGSDWLIDFPTRPGDGTLLCVEEK